MNLRFLTIICAPVLFALPACKNNDQLFKTVLYTNVNVVNAGTDTLNFYLNGTRQNNASSLFPGGQFFYISEPSGSQNYQFKKSGVAPTCCSVCL